MKHIEMQMYFEFCNSHHWAAGSCLCALEIVSVTLLTLLAAEADAEELQKICTTNTVISSHAFPPFALRNKLLCSILARQGNRSRSVVCLDFLTPVSSAASRCQPQLPTHNFSQNNNSKVSKVKTNSA